MKERLLALLEEYQGTITEAVINEIIDDEYPLQSLLYIEEKGVEWGLVKCLEFEKDAIKFFNKHYKEIENIRIHLQEIWVSTDIPEWYSMKHYYANISFKFIAFEVYMELVFEDL